MLPYLSETFIADTLLIRIILSFLVIVLHVTFVKVNEHDTIINQGVVEIMLYLLKTFSNDVEIIHLIFQVLVTLMCSDAEKVKRRQQQLQYRSNGKDDCTNDQFNNFRTKCTKNCQELHRTARRIHLLEGKDLIQTILDIYQHRNEDIRILGKSIIKDLIKAESFAAMEMSWYVLQHEI